MQGLALKGLRPSLSGRPTGAWAANEILLGRKGDRCSFVRRVEVLCHDINVHVPHHISSKIPWYNLRAATDSLRENWGQVRPPPRSAISSDGNTPNQLSALVESAVWSLLVAQMV